MMKRSVFCLLIPLRGSAVLWLLLTVGSVFAAIPIQDSSLRGTAAAEARLSLLSAAESCLGIPYRYAGIDRSGLDCSGLVYVSFRDGLRITVPRSSGGIYNWAEKISDAELEPGDLVFFSTTGPGVSHLGIYAGDGKFIHSASEGPRTGVIYSRLDEAYWERTYMGAGRALPWDDEAARFMAALRREGTALSSVPDTPGTSPAGYSGTGGNALLPAAPPEWREPGFFSGFGAAWTWGGFIEGAPSVFRGFTVLATAGYKFSNYRAAFEIRPEWDRALGVFRLPFALSIGTDTFQLFAGPAYTFGEPSLVIGNRERRYDGGGNWYWEAGFSAALPPFRIRRGALSLYAELACQPYHRNGGESFSLKPDITANMRFSTGLRYLWRLGN